jgi:hypothetical protein
MIELAIAASEHVRFDIVHALSRNRWSDRDLERAHTALGFAPADAAEDYRDRSPPTSRR